MNARILTLPEFKSLLQRGETPGEAPLIRCGMTLIEKTEADSIYDVTFTASTDEVDRHDDRIMVGGWRLDRYLSNPVLILNHDYNTLPIGRVQALTVTGNALKAQALLDSEDPLARKVASKIATGMINAVSVGLIPLRWEFSKDPDREYGFDILESELLEISVVSIPANPSALIDRRDAPLPLPKFITGSRQRAERTLSVMNLRGKPQS